MTRPHGVASAVAGTLFLAALSTFGDWVWARFIPSHRMGFGLAHGAVVCLAIGLALGAPRGRAWRGAVAGTLIGLGAAGGFYLLAPAIGYAAMFMLWMALWAAFGVLNGRGLGEPRTSVRESLLRGVLAAIASGLAFYAISGIWTRPSPGGPNYAYHFLCWTVAYLPGFLVLVPHDRDQAAAGKDGGGSLD